MFSFVRAIRNGLAFVMAVAMLMTLSLPSHAAVGTVRIKIVKAGFIVGVGGGNGVLHFEGRNYHLGIGGISVGTIGAAGADFSRPRLQSSSCRRYRGHLYGRFRQHRGRGWRENRAVAELERRRPEAARKASGLRGVRLFERIEHIATLRPVDLPGIGSLSTLARMRLTRLRELALAARPSQGRGEIASRLRLHLEAHQNGPCSRDAVLPHGKAKGDMALELPLEFSMRI